MRAVLTEPGQPDKIETAKSLAAIQPDTMAQGRAALVGGALQGATFGFGDELSAGAGALLGDGDYTKLRDEQRQANRDAEAGDPAAYGKGKLGGSLASMVLPLGMVNSAKPLLSVSNTARATALGDRQRWRGKAR
jgi:hypothetical protein